MRLSENEKIINNLRLKQLVRCIPDIFDYKSVLYVGARKNGLIFVDEFKKNKCSIDLVEVFKKNCDDVSGLNLFDNIYNENIKEFKTDKIYDVVMWYHGIEHIEKHEIDVVNNISVYKKILVLGCPFGVYNQSEIYGNKYERHLSAWYPEDFTDWNTDTIGKRDIPTNNLLIWRRK